MSRKKQRKGVYRTYDYVRIVEPQVFIRCGYDKTLDQEIEVVEEKYSAAIDKLLCEVGLSFDSSDSRIICDDDNSALRLRKKIVSEIAYTRFSQKSWRGGERKIFTEHKEEVRDRVVQILRKKVVKTGFYEPAHGSQTFDGELDFTPAYLSQETTHIILDVHDWKRGSFWIEAKNVEAVTEKESNGKRD